MKGAAAFAVVADVTCAADVERLVAMALEAYGRIDILVNNVGIAVVGGPAELDEATWDRLMSVNIKSAYLTCHHVLPVMIRQHAGAIVNNASVAVLGWAGVNYGFYAASKGAMVAMTRTMAIRHAPDGIRANCVLPGLMNTPLVHAALTRVYGEEGDIANLIRTRDAQCPLGHMGDAWDTGLRGAVPGLRRGQVHHRHRTRRRWRLVGTLRVASRCDCRRALLRDMNMIELTAALRRSGGQRLLQQLFARRIQAALLPVGQEKAQSLRAGKIIRRCRIQTREVSGAFGHAQRTD
jgi:NAD(P)-dependent dehydrogenase (short-subunit alcohol dehydrogenase family)